jgi:hypothetical protein
MWIILLFTIAIVISGCSSYASCGPNECREPSFVQTVAEMKHSIAPVVCLTLNLNGTLSVTIIEGTAFFISKDGTFVTPRHVIVGLAQCPKPAIYFQNTKWAGTNNLDVHWFSFLPNQCAVDDSLDLAKCTTQDHLSNPENAAYRPTPVIIDASVKEDGTPVAFTGFPLEDVVPLTSRGIVGGYLIDSVGAFSRLVVDKSAWPGASGSPIYTANGQVVGIVIATGTGAAAGITIGRSSVAISTFLKAHP